MHRERRYIHAFFSYATGGGGLSRSNHRRSGAKPAIKTLVVEPQFLQFLECGKAT